MRTTELTGAALNRAVVKCVEKDAAMRSALGRFTFTAGRKFEPSTNWADGGPIIDREKISVVRDEGDDYWQAVMNAQSGSMFGPGLCGDHWASGPTALIAAMRCYVASKLGDEVDVPEELI